MHFLHANGVTKNENALFIKLKMLRWKGNRYFDLLEKEVTYGF